MYVLRCTRVFIRVFYVQQQELDKHFHQMEKIVGDRKTNSRVRFLMMDVIDLRRNSWIPRRDESKPKTKAQVHEVSRLFI